MRQEQSEFDRVSRKEPELKSLDIVNVLRKFLRRYSYKFRLHDGHIPEGKQTVRRIILNYKFLDEGNFHWASTS